MFTVAVTGRARHHGFGTSMLMLRICCCFLLSQVEQPDGTGQPGAVLQLSSRHVFDWAHTDPPGQLHGMRSRVLFVGAGCHRQQHVQAVPSWHVLDRLGHHHCRPVHQVRRRNVLGSSGAVIAFGLHTLRGGHFLAGHWCQLQHDVHAVRHGAVV